MWPPVVALVLSLAGSVAHAQDAQDAQVALGCDADEARRRVCAVDDSLRSALVRADTATLSRLYADDLLTVNYRGVRSTKDGLLRAIGSGALRFDTLLVRRRTTAFHGDTAVVTGSMHQVARGPEGAHPLEVGYVRVYIRHAGGWRLVRATLHAADRSPNESLQLTERPVVPRGVRSSQ
jgi:ketosteroid isomerase-like protein